MKNKKLFIFIVGSILISTCVVFEYMLPSDASANTYYLKVEKEGQSVKHNQFKGYKYTEKVYDVKGKQKTVSFYSTKKLTKHEQFKIVVNDNQLVSKYKKLQRLPKNIKYYAGK